MEIGVEQAVPKDVAQEIVDDVRREDVQIDPARTTRLDPRFTVAQIRQYCVTLEEFGHEYAWREVRPEHQRHALVLAGGGVAAKPLHVPRLGPVIEFLARPEHKLRHRLDEPVCTANAEALNQPHR